MKHICFTALQTGQTPMGPLNFKVKVEGGFADFKPQMARVVASGYVVDASAHCGAGDSSKSASRPICFASVT
jgi:hypothetical protein